MPKRILPTAFPKAQITRKIVRETSFHYAPDRSEVGRLPAQTNKRPSSARARALNKLHSSQPILARGSDGRQRIPQLHEAFVNSLAEATKNSKQQHAGDIAVRALYAVDATKKAKAIRTRHKHVRTGRIAGGSDQLRMAARPHTSHRYRTSSILDEIKDRNQDVRPRNYPGALTSEEPGLKPLKGESYETTCTFGPRSTTPSCHSDFYSGFARTNSRLPDVRVFDKDMKDYKKLVFNPQGAAGGRASPTKDQILAKDNYSILKTGQIVGVQIDDSIGWDEEAETRRGHVMAPHPTQDGKYGIKYEDGEQDFEVPRNKIHIALAHQAGPPILNWRRPEHLRAPIIF
jgi:hypothetical protein